MDTKLHLTCSPHIHSGNNTSKVMLDVIIALLPTTIAGVILFGLSAAVVIGVTVAVAVLAEFLFNLIIKKEQTIGDLSAVVTGLLLALNLPANIPLWQAAVGAVFAIIVVKCLFGGIGCNIVNPAIAARVFMLIAFKAVQDAAFPIDTASGATPLQMLDKGKIPDLLDLLLGKRGGAIGEVCTIALLIGGIYLLVRKVITWQIPVCFIGTVFVLSFLFDGFDIVNAAAWTMSGGLFIGAFFMATDYVTSPSTPWGKVIFGCVAGIITAIIRLSTTSSYPEAVSFAILLVNILNPYIESLTPRKLFGGNKK